MSWFDGRALVRRYEYHGPDGTVLFWHDRYALPDGGKTFGYGHQKPGQKRVRHWKPGTRPVDAIDADAYLYRLPEVLAAVRAGRRVWWCEGEKDAETVVAQGKVGTSHHGGAGKVFQEMANWLAGSDVYVVLDNDIPGYHDGWLRYQVLKAVGARVRFRAPVHPYKDVTDHIEAGFTLRQMVRVPKATVRAQALRYTEATARAAGY